MSSFPDRLLPGWKKSLAPEKSENYFRTLAQFLRGERSSGQVVFPSSANVLRALHETDLDQVRVVVLGQDPYHGAGQAMGRSFAVPNELLPKPPSLVNIFKEMESDLGAPVDHSQSDLSGWVEQGVLLLNSVLTVRQSQAFSHRDKGWETFTDRVIEVLSSRPEPMVFFLWGAAAARKGARINSRHLIIQSPHPSPLSAYRGFFGSRPFSRANEFLVSLGQEPIDWGRTSVGQPVQEGVDLRVEPTSSPAPVSL